MFKKKPLLYLLFTVLLVFSVAAVSIGYSAYKGYQCYSQGKVADYILEKWKSRLDLSDVQVTEIKTIIDNTKAQREDMREKMRNERKAVADIFFTEGSTKEELQTRMERIKDDVSGVMNTFTGVAIDIRNVLTSEQLGKLKEYYDNKGSCRYRRQ